MVTKRARVACHLQQYPALILQCYPAPEVGYHVRYLHSFWRYTAMGVRWLGGEIRPKLPTRST
jgi:hypothetical protein